MQLSKLDQFFKKGKLLIFGIFLTAFGSVSIQALFEVGQEVGWALAQWF